MSDTSATITGRSLRQRQPYEELLDGKIQAPAKNMMLNRDVFHSGAAADSLNKVYHRIVEGSPNTAQVRGKPKWIPDKSIRE